MENREPIRNVCRDCAHFVDDFDELTQEMMHMARDGANQGVFIASAERARNEHGNQVGDKLEKTFWNFKTVATALQDRFGMALSDTGLCEAGVARFVHRLAGSVAGAHQCPKWKAPTTRLYRVRATNWRDDRDRSLEIRAVLSTLPHTVRKADPCPCGKGLTFGICCNKFL